MGSPHTWLWGQALYRAKHSMGPPHTWLWGQALYGAALTHGYGAKCSIGPSTLWGCRTRGYRAEGAMGSPHTWLWGQEPYRAKHSIGQPHTRLWGRALYRTAPHLLPHLSAVHQQNLQRQSRAVSPHPTNPI